MYRDWVLGIDSFGIAPVLILVCNNNNNNKPLTCRAHLLAVYLFMFQYLSAWSLRTYSATGIGRPQSLTQPKASRARRNNKSLYSHTQFARTQRHTLRNIAGAVFAAVKPENMHTHARKHVCLSSAQAHNRQHANQRQIHTAMWLCSTAHGGDSEAQVTFVRVICGRRGGETFLENTRTNNTQTTRTLFRLSVAAVDRHAIIANGQAHGGGGEAAAKPGHSARARLNRDDDGGGGGGCDRRRWWECSLNGARVAFCVRYVFAVLLVNCYSWWGGNWIGLFVGPKTTFTL